MSQRFSYVKYTETSVAKQEAFKAMFESVEAYAMQSLVDGRSRSLCLTALEEAYMWTGKAIRDEQMNPPMGYISPNSQVSMEDQYKRHQEKRGAQI